MYHSVSIFQPLLVRAQRGLLKKKIRVQLLYNAVLVSVQQHESAICIRIPPSLLSLLPTPHAHRTPLGHHTAWS